MSFLPEVKRLIYEECHTITQALKVIRFFFYFISAGASAATMIWDQVFKNGPSEIFGRQVLNNLK